MVSPWQAYQHCSNAWQAYQHCLKISLGGMQIDVKASDVVRNCSEATVLDLEALELLPTEKGRRRVLPT